MRALNIEEKRKLEKLLLSDIDATIAIHSTKRRAERAPVARQALEKEHQSKQNDYSPVTSSKKITSVLRGRCAKTRLRHSERLAQ
jgi:hypothetical protein